MLQFYTRPAVQGLVNIKRGDALCLVGSNIVSNRCSDYKYVIGQSLEDCEENDVPIKVLVKGFAQFDADEYSRLSDGDFEVFSFGVVMSLRPGKVRVVKHNSDILKDSNGIVVGFHDSHETVDVLL